MNLEQELAALRAMKESNKTNKPLSQAESKYEICWHCKEVRATELLSFVRLPSTKVLTEYICTPCYWCAGFVGPPDKSGAPR